MVGLETPLNGARSCSGPVRGPIHRALDLWRFLRRWFPGVTQVRGGPWRPWCRWPSQRSHLDAGSRPGAWGLGPGRGRCCGSVASAQPRRSLSLGLSLTLLPCVHFLSLVIPVLPSERRVQPPRGAAVWWPSLPAARLGWGPGRPGAGPRVAALLTTCWARGVRGWGRQPQISGSAKCLFFSGKKKKNQTI